MKINEVIDYMNNRFNQQNESEYSFVYGSKPMVIRLDDETAISTWSCGAVVCIRSLLYFIQEDDGHWFGDENVGQTTFSIAWADSFAKAINDLCKYVEENGEPFYYCGTNMLCGYELKKKSEK